MWLDQKGGAAVLLTFLLILALFAYFLPTVMASSRGHQNIGMIFLTNLLLGWTVLGWIAGLVWAATAVTPAPARPPFMALSRREVREWQQGGRDDEVERLVDRNRNRIRQAGHLAADLSKVGDANGACLAAIGSGRPRTSQQCSPLRKVRPSRGKRPSGQGCRSSFVNRSLTIFRVADPDDLFGNRKAGVNLLMLFGAK